MELFNGRFIPSTNKADTLSLPTGDTCSARQGTVDTNGNGVIDTGEPTGYLTAYHCLSDEFAKDGPALVDKHLNLLGFVHLPSPKTNDLLTCQSDQKDFYLTVGQKREDSSLYDGQLTDIAFWEEYIGTDINELTEPKIEALERRHNDNPEIMSAIYDFSERGITYSMLENDVNLGNPVEEDGTLVSGAQMYQGESGALCSGDSGQGVVSTANYLASKEPWLSNDNE